MYLNCLQFQTVRFKTYLLSLGVSDPVTKSAFGSSAEYYKKLAEELAGVLCAPLKVRSFKFLAYIVFLNIFIMLS